MASDTFSRRRGFAPRPNPVPENEVPPGVRDEFLDTLRDFTDLRKWDRAPERFYDRLYVRLRRWIRKELRPGSRNPQGDALKAKLCWLMNVCEWWQFYDICEDVYREVAEDYGQPNAETFADEVNHVFAREGVVWRFAAEGRIERVYPPVITEKLEEARTLLQDSRFRGADEQFEKARQHLNRRPDPDKENCVKDAVGAVESTARIISGRLNALLPDILKKEPFISGIHPTLRDALVKIYAYRGDEAAHGQVGPSEIGIEEAEWVLTMSSAAILYLANKFGKPTS